MKSVEGEVQKKVEKKNPSTFFFSSSGLPVSLETAILRPVATDHQGVRMLNNLSNEENGVNLDI